MQRTDAPEIDAATFHTDVQYIEALWQRVPIGEADMPLIDTGSDKGEPLVFVPILEHLEFVYARQVRAFGQRRRVIMYRRHETRTQPVGLVERAEELRKVLDALGLESVDLVGHGDAAMVLFEFAARYPQRCRSLIIVAQGADYRIAPHPFIWLLHELFVRLPVEYILPAWFLRRTVINYIVANGPASARLAALTMPILLINRANDELSPEEKTRWLAGHLPNCAGYHVIAGGERFFMYSQAETVNALIEEFLTSRAIAAGN